MTNDTLKRQRISWTDAELELLVQETALLRFENTVAGLTELMNQAQQKLPADRRRRITSVTILPGFVDRVRLAVESLAARPGAAAPAPVDPAAVITAAPTATLIAELAGRLLASMTSLEQRMVRIESALCARPSYLNGHTAAPPASLPESPARKAKRLVVAVVGLLPAQTQELAERCKKMSVDLRFLSKDQHSRAFPSGTDHVLLFTKFIDHAWQTAAYNCFGRDRVHAHHGGLEKAAEAIEKILSKP